MTTPTVSHGTSRLIDNYLSTQWDIANHLNGATATFANTYDDWIDFYVGADPTAATFIHSSADGDNPTDWGHSTTVDTKLRYRYKVTGTAHLKLTVMLHAAGETTVLADGTSSTFTSAVYTLPADALDGWRIYNHTGTGHVYVDFLYLYHDDFTLPNTAHGDNITPPIRDVKMQIPGRLTNITQGMGSDDIIYECSCDLDVGTWKRTGDVFDAQVVREIAHELSVGTADFVWLDTGEDQFKARIEPPVISRTGDGRRLDLRFVEYSRCGAGNYTYIERYGLNL